MPAEWRIQSWPRCTYHVFLSHCAEDRDRLVKPVYEELGRRGIAAWADWHHYPPGQGAFDTLREELLACRHVVYFVTPSFLRQGRGWAAAERAYADVIQRHLTFGTTIAVRVELPLLFLPPGARSFMRCAWRSLIDKAAHCRLPKSLADLDALQVVWAADVVERFVRQQHTWGLEIGRRMEKDRHLGEFFSTEDDLRRRVIAESPPLLPRSS